MPPHLVEHPAQGIKCLHNLRIPMEDGVRLAADLYAPLAATLDGSDPLPVVMEYIPYRKDDVGVPSDSHWYGYLPAARIPHAARRLSRHRRVRGHLRGTSTRCASSATGTTWSSGALRSPGAMATSA